MHKNKFLGVDRMFTEDKNKTDIVNTIRDSIKDGKTDALKKVQMLRMKLTQRLNQT